VPVLENIPDRINLFDNSVIVQFESKVKQDYNLFSSLCLKIEEGKIERLKEIEKRKQNKKNKNKGNWILDGALEREYTDEVNDYIDDEDEDGMDHFLADDNNEEEDNQEKDKYIDEIKETITFNMNFQDGNNTESIQIKEDLTRDNNMKRRKKKNIQFKTREELAKECLSKMGYTTGSAMMTNLKDDNEKIKPIRDKSIVEKKRKEKQSKTREELVKECFNSMGYTLGCAMISEQKNKKDKIKITEHYQRNYCDTEEFCDDFNLMQLDVHHHLIKPTNIELKMYTNKKSLLDLGNHYLIQEKEKKEENLIIDYFEKRKKRSAIIAGANFLENFKQQIKEMKPPLQFSLIDHFTNFCKVTDYDGDELIIVLKKGVYVVEILRAFKINGLIDNPRWLNTFYSKTNDIDLIKKEIICNVNSYGIVVPRIIHKCTPIIAVNGRQTLFAFNPYREIYIILPLMLKINGKVQPPDNKQFINVIDLKGDEYVRGYDKNFSTIFRDKKYTTGENILNYFDSYKHVLGILGEQAKSITSSNIDEVNVFKTSEAFDPYNVIDMRFDALIKISKIIMKVYKHYRFKKDQNDDDSYDFVDFDEYSVNKVGFNNI